MRNIDISLTSHWHLIKTSWHRGIAPWLGLSTSTGPWCWTVASLLPPSLRRPCPRISWSGRRTSTESCSRWSGRPQWRFAVKWSTPRPSGIRNTTQTKLGVPALDHFIILRLPRKWLVPGCSHLFSLEFKEGPERIWKKWTLDLTCLISLYQFIIVFAPRLMPCLAKKHGGAPRRHRTRPRRPRPGSKNQTTIWDSPYFTWFNSVDVDWHVASCSNVIKHDKTQRIF